MPISVMQRTRAMRLSPYPSRCVEELQLEGVSSRKAHLPEVRLQPRRLAEQRRQFDEAPFGHRSRGEIIEMTARPDGDLLIGVARVFADPLAIGMRAERVRAVGRQLAGRSPRSQ